jgi:hypothetical protein
MKRKIPIVLIYFLLASSMATIFSLSMMPNHSIEDPNSSQSLLADENFLEENNLSTLSSPRYSIQLSTMGRGDPLYVWFGHSGLIINDLESKRSVMYDFGVFSFDEGFYQSFALGRLWYQAWGTSSEARFALATDEMRDVRTITLDFSQDVTLEVLKHLNKTTEPKHSTYLYHHYRENCATRIRDILDKATDGQLKAYAQSTPYPLTIRQIVASRTASSPFIYWTLDFLQNNDIDQPITYWEAMFMPEIMEQVILDFSYIDKQGNERKLAKETTIINEAPTDIRPSTNERPKKATTIMFLSSLILATLSHLFYVKTKTSQFNGIRVVSKLMYTIINGAWILLGSIYTLVLLFMMTMSNHDVTYGNENILVISPLLILMAVELFRFTFSRTRTDRIFRKLQTISLFLLLVLLVAKGVFPEYLNQQNLHIILIMFPLYLVNSTFFTHAYRVKTRIISDKTW